MSKSTKLTQPQINPKVNNLLSGFEGSQSNYPQDLANTQLKYFNRSTGFNDSVSRVAEFRPSVEGSRYPIDHQNNFSEVEYMRRVTTDQDAKFNQLKRDMEEMTNKFLMLKNTTQTEILNVRDTIQAQADKDRNRSDNNPKYDKRISDLEQIVAGLDDQAKKRNRSSPESSKIGGKEGVLGDLERRIEDINENVRRNMKIMDVNLVELLREKEDAIKRLTHDTLSLKTNVGILSDHIIKLERILQTKVDEGQLSKIIEPHLANASKADFSASQSRQTGGGGVELNLDSKIKEIEGILSNVTLMEKDFRGKYELYDLNLSSIKRHMELELTMTLKQNIVPLQKNIESYLQGVESRIAYLEDVVTKEIRRESFILPNERDQRHGKQSKFGHGARDSMNFGNHLLDSQFEGRSEQPPGQGTRENSQENTIRDSRMERGTASNLHNIQTHESVRIDDEDAMNYRQTHKNELLSNTAKHLVQDSFNPKTSSLSGSIRKVESRNSEFPLLNDMPVPAKTTSAFKMLYQDFARNQSQEKTIKSTKELQKMRSQAQRFEEPQDQHESRHERLQAEESGTLEGLSGLLTNENDVSLSSGKMKRPTQQSSVLDQKGNDPIESASKKLKESDFDEEENYHGNIKGLLRKSRSQRESSLPKEDPRQNQQYEPQGGKSYGNRQLAPEPKQQFRDAGLYNQNIPQKGGLGANKRPLPLQQEDPNPLPPLNVKGGKSFNQNKYSQPNQGAGRNQPQRGPGAGGGYARGDALNRPYMVDPQIDEVQEGEDVEEIVYHVNEEGFLVDENGNFLVDEQGNYIQLSEDQMREIEENEMVYDEQEEDYYQ